MKTIVLLATLLCCSGASAATNDSYAGQQDRAIKSLSDQEQADLLAGKGMGLAKAGELNGYPGPRHVLDLANELGLSTNQRAATQRVFENMQARAQALGKEIVEAEQVLDRAFAERQITDRELERALAKIGALNAQLRGVHLAAHLEQTRLLSPMQVARYNELRGYSSGSSSAHDEHADHGH